MARQRLKWMDYYQVHGRNAAELQRRQRALPVVRQRIDWVLVVLDQDLGDRLRQSPLWRRP